MLRFASSFFRSSISRLNFNLIFKFQKTRLCLTRFQTCEFMSSSYVHCSRYMLENLKYVWPVFICCVSISMPLDYNFLHHHLHWVVISFIVATAEQWVLSPPHQYHWYVCFLILFVIFTFLIVTAISYLFLIFLILFNEFLDVFHLRNRKGFFQQQEVVGMWWLSFTFFSFHFYFCDSNVKVWWTCLP